MEKSMVHQLNPLVTSNVQYSRASFIHTVYQTDFNQLRKSRIQNLPNYRKQDLSGKLNFVVVFQGIEIERLSVQIQTLRIKIKDYERQICNYENYQVQIRQLTQKCHSYQLQRQDHQQAMQKMSKICQQLYNQLQQMRNRYADIDLSLKQKYRIQKQRSTSLSSQLEKWKARYNASQTSKIKQLEDMRMMLQNQRKSMLQRQIRQISVKYESERSILESQLRKLRQNLQNRNIQIQRMRCQIEQCKMKEGQLRQYESRLDEYEDKLMMMAQENMRLNQLLRIKKQEIQTLKNNERNLQNRLANSKRIQDQFNQVNKRIQNYETEIREWNQKYSRLQAQNNRNQILSNKAQQYQRLLDNSAQEMQKLNTIIRQKISQIQKWKSHSQKLMMELQVSKNTETKIAEYEEAISEIATQNQRLNQVLRARLQQIQNWKLKYSQIQAKIPLLSQSQNQCKNLKEKLTVEVNTRAKMSQKIALLSKDLQKAAQIQQAWIKQKNANKDLQRQIDRLNGSIRSLSAQNNDYSKKVQSLEGQLRENSGIIDQLNQCKRKISIMTQQIDRINGVIHQKIQQIKQLKQNYNSVSINASRYRQIQQQFVYNLQQTQQLVLKLDESRRQNEMNQQKIMTIQAKCKKLQGQIFTNNQQKDKLIMIVNQKKGQLEDLVARMQKADQKLSELQKVEQEYKTLKSSHSQLQSRYKQIETRFNKQTKRSEQFSNQVQSLTAQIFKLRNQTNFSKQFVTEFVNLKIQAQQKDKTIASLMQQISIVQKCIALLKQENKKNYNKMCQYHNKWSTLNTNFECVSIFMDKFFQLQGKIQKLSEQNLKLESSLNLMNIQMAQSSYAGLNSYKKLQQNRNQVVQLKVKKQESTSPSAKLSQIEQDYQVKRVISQQNILYQQNKGNVNPPISIQNNQNGNYYESQVTELYGNNAQSPTNYSKIQSTTYWQRPQSSNVSSYTVKTLRPGSHQSTATYTYTTTSNYSNSNISSPQQYRRFGNSQVINSNAYQGSNVNSSNYNHHYVSNVQNHSNYHFSNEASNMERPSSTFIKQGKQTYSQMKLSPDPKDQVSNYQQNQGRRYVLSPVRFLN